MLKSNGVMSVTVDYTDHWQHSDHSISVYNYMKYTDRQWKRYNPPMHYQNRLQHSDYKRMITDCGFDVLAEVQSKNEPDDKAMLSHIRLSGRFKRYKTEELLIRREHFVARKN